MSKLITGHMPRVSGVVHLAKAGLEIWKIQIFCRWGSDVILRYIQDAPLEQSHKWARDAAVGLGPTEARNELVSQFLITNPDKVPSLPEGSLELASARIPDYTQTKCMSRWRSSCRERTTGGRRFSLSSRGNWWQQLPE